MIKKKTLDRALVQCVDFFVKLFKDSKEDSVAHLEGIHE